MAPPGIGYYLRYASYRAIRQDHALYLANGGAFVPWPGSGVPPQGTPVLVRLETPQAETFELAGRVDRHTPGKGFMVALSADMQAALQALDRRIQSADFTRRAEAESPADERRPLVGRLDPAELKSASEPIDEGEDTAADMAAVDDETNPELDAGGLPEDPEPSIEPGDAPALSDDQDGPTRVRHPEPGSSHPVYTAKFSTLLDFVDAEAILESTARMRIEVEDAEARPNDPALLRIILPGHNRFDIWVVVERKTPAFVEVRASRLDQSYRTACNFLDSVAAKSRLQKESPSERRPILFMRTTETVPELDESRMPIRRRLARMGMEEKMNLALSGDREERMALAMDSNKAIHHYLLKNAKLTLDEVGFMARLPSLNPDVLEKIAENPAFTQNPTILKNLVFNPKTPVQTAIRLLDRLPRPELMNIAKRTTMNRRLVMAAKLKVEGKK